MVIGLLAAGCRDSELDLRDAETLEKVLSQALEVEWTALRGLPDSGDEEGELFFKPGGESGYSGWAKATHANGQVSHLVHYKDGKPHGRFGAWHENGKLGAEAYYKDGKLHGLFIQWHENGQMKIETPYRDGIKHGRFNGWYEAGQQAMRAHWEDDVLISATAWKPDGTKCPISNVSQGTGSMASYQEGGRLGTEANYKDGKLHGRFTYWYENGQKKIESNSKNGEQEGLFTLWYKSGQKMAEGEYENGEKEGLWTSWNTDGTVAEQTRFQNGVEVK